MEESGSTKIEKDANASINNENQNIAIQIEESDSRGNENRYNSLVDYIKIRMEMAPEPRSSTGCRICKVPYEIRKWNEEAYTPKVVSIGPLHHRKRRLVDMEEIKVRYFKSYLKRTGAIVEDLVSFIGAQEGNIRSCYADQPISLNSDDFVKMILFDASFILEFFIKHNREMISDDHVLEPTWVSTVYLDLVLLENQLPFFVIEELFYFAPPTCSNFPFKSLIELASSSLIFLNIPEIDESNNFIFIKEIKHLTDLLRTAHISQFMMEPNYFFLDEMKEASIDFTYFEYNELHYSATQLHEAGVEFKKSSSDCLVDLKLNANELQVAKIGLTDKTETIIRNIIALEQVRYVGEEYVTNYFLNLSSLINSTKDLDLLCDKGIIVHQVDDSSKATSRIKNLCNGPIRASRSGYSSIIYKLNKYYERPWRTQLHVWKNTLKRDYFSNPWRSAATIAAIILLVLTFIQTVCSIMK